MDVRVGLWWKLSAKKLMLLNCGVGEDLESPLDCKEIQPVHLKRDQSWVFVGRTDAEAETLATSCEDLTHWKRPWCWEGLGAGGEGDNRGWDSWMTSLTQWAWVWVNSGSWWFTGRPGMLRFMGSQRVGNDWATELNWTELNHHVNLENSAVVTRLEKVSFHSNPKERQCQRMLKLPHNCTHLTCYQS